MSCYPCKCVPFILFERGFRLRAVIAQPPKCRAPGLHLELFRNLSWKSRHCYLFPLLLFAKSQFKPCLTLMLSLS
ncbi:hypothetical protein BGW80DRAFT_1286214 [Lactifluus volemus]|nr:hypothetical protein BGW80DRAFT_1396468 [Lactifluus volemus]KAH9971611.1 hypothetical protein BGW80DRAFT_1321392 [Lactifluus volemus]KAH9972233.1 hypothetical protein BGW80DRAFT_1315052 [Lactifluus volemus]KAH9975105.1 hypothetical protein BGW80DRAFT_1300288 [Lactifluus volemus]KAH9978177.1 hypothetical protein BGW80DRAFT_1286214 [Lactifluus volemus]